MKQEGVLLFSIFRMDLNSAILIILISSHTFCLSLLRCRNATITTRTIQTQNASEMYEYIETVVHANDDYQ